MITLKMNKTKMTKMLSTLNRMTTISDTYLYADGQFVAVKGTYELPGYHMVFISEFSGLAGNETIWPGLILNFKDCIKQIKESLIGKCEISMEIDVNRIDVHVTDNEGKYSIFPIAQPLPTDVTDQGMLQTLHKMGEEMNPEAKKIHVSTEQLESIRDGNVVAVELGEIQNVMGDKLLPTFRIAKTAFPFRGTGRKDAAINYTVDLYVNTKAKELGLMEVTMSVTYPNLQAIHQYNIVPYRI